MDNFTLIQNTLDVGDFIEVCGTLFATKRGEKSISPTLVRIIGKSIRPLPSEWYGLEDTEIRLRKRYLDMLTHPEIRELFIKKDIFWTTIRNFLKNEEFREVETAVLEPIPGGAEAEPFITHHNALDTNFYLRISLELPLKRLLVGGFEKVFEIGRIFRNEGIDREHLQDYTQMECYWAYADYNNMMDLTRKMYQEVVKQITGGYVTTYQDMKIDWGGEWPLVDYYDEFKKETGLDLKIATVEDLKKKAEELKIRLRDWGFTETYTYSMISEELMDTFNLDKTRAYKIANPLSYEWVYMRPSLRPSMLTTIKQNVIIIGRGIKHAHQCIERISRKTKIS